MATDYSTIGYAALREYIANSPVETPAYIKASAELNRMYTKFGLLIAALSVVCGVIWHFLK